MGPVCNYKRHLECHDGLLSECLSRLVGVLFQVFSWFLSSEFPLTSLDLALTVAGREHLFVSPLGNGVHNVMI